MTAAGVADTLNAQCEAARWPRRSRADDQGLTTLEWLLIVAAVAGLAALAVVLVQNVVSDTSEQIAGSSARKTAAQVAADEIMRNADRNHTEQPVSVRQYSEWEAYYTSRCDRLEITHADAGIRTAAKFKLSPSGTVGPSSNVVADDISTGGVDATALVLDAAVGGSCGPLQGVRRLSRTPATSTSAWGRPIMVAKTEGVLAGRSYGSAGGCDADEPNSWTEMPSVGGHLGHITLRPEAEGGKLGSGGTDRTHKRNPLRSAAPS